MKQIECAIPFTPEIKFNIFIRDMNKSELHPANKEDSLTVFMKGVPERLINKCNKILVNGVEQDLDEEW